MSEQSPGNGDSSRVTTFQLYQKVVDLERSFNNAFSQLQRQMEGQMADLRSQVSSLRQTIGTNKDEGIQSMLNDHEHRMRPIERWKNALPVATILFMATTVLAVVALFVRN